MLICVVRCVLVLLAVPCGGAMGAVPRYSIVALNVLPGGLDSLAFGLNDVGQVVGSSRLNRSGNVGQSRPVVWDYSGQPTELWSEQSVGANLFDINNAGEIVGHYGSGSDIPLPGPGVPYGRAFYWSEATGRIDIGFEPVGNSQAVAINELGQVVGTSERLELVEVEPGNFVNQFIPHPFIWDKENGIRDLGTLGGYGGFATAINDLGQVVGYADIPSGYTRAFGWDAQNGMQELSSTSNQDSQAVSINDLGQALGYDFGAGAVIWDVSTENKLSAYDGRDLNNSGQIVGGSIFDPVVWTMTHGAQRLTDLIALDADWNLEIAFAINDSGSIVGYGHLNGEVRGFLMTPVPEPGSLLLCSIGVAVVILERVRG